MSNLLALLTVEILIFRGIEISRGEKDIEKVCYRVEISPKFPTTCYSKRRKEGERERSRVNENLCGGTKRASRPRMHVRATNADRKSIKRLLHPRHSAASSSSWEPASFFSLYPSSRFSSSSRFLSRLSLSLPPFSPPSVALTSPNTVPYQCAIHPLPERKGFFQVAQ